MTLRIRIGPFTFGRTGARLSLWGTSGGLSVPLTKSYTVKNRKTGRSHQRKNKTFGAARIGPFRWFF